MVKQEFIMLMEKFVTREAVGVTAMRGQKKKTLRKVRKYTEDLLGSLKEIDSEDQYLNWLNLHTIKLGNKVHSWGAARKALNLFMRTAFYNYYLNKEYKLRRLEAWLETPLDRIVAKKLKRSFPKEALPSWPGVKHLSSIVSDRFQEAASAVAMNERRKTVHMDVFLWVQE